MLSEGGFQSGNRQAVRCCLALIATLGALLSVACGDHLKYAGEKDVYQDIDDSRQVLDRRSCLIGRDHFSEGDSEMLLSRMRSFATNSLRKYPLARMTLVPCDGNTLKQFVEEGTYSIAQVLILGDTAEARLRLGREVRTVRLAGASNLGRLQVAGFNFELYAFRKVLNHYPVVKGSTLAPEIVFEMRSSRLPPTGVGAQLLRMIESHFKDLRVGAEIKAGFDKPSDPLDDRGFRQHDGSGMPFLQCVAHQCFEVPLGEPH